MTEAAPIRLSCPVPGWWIPMWVSLADGATGPDPLEEAGHALVRAGVDRAESIAQVLCVDSVLVESALAGLALSGRLTTADGRWRATTTDVPTQARTEREGWIFWDPVANKPLMQLWIGPRPEELAVPAGWEALAIDGKPQGRPSIVEVDRVLSLLAGVPEVLGLEGRGSAFAIVDMASVRSVRRDPRKPIERGVAHVPIELRPVTGPVVWRPAIVRFGRVQTPLDPRGWRGLLDRLEPEGCALLERRRREASVAIAPGVLEAAGYERVEDLEEAIELEARRTFGARWEASGWQNLSGLIRNAERHAVVSRAVGGDWRSALHGWADVLDALVAEACDRVAGDRDEETFARVRELTTKERHRRIRAHGATLGDVTTAKLVGDVATDANLDELAAALRTVPSIGPRISGLAFAFVFGRDGRTTLAPALDSAPSFFVDLDRANKDRRKIAHLGGDDSVDVASFRQRVITLARAAMSLP